MHIERTLKSPARKAAVWAAPVLLGWILAVYVWHIADRPSGAKFVLEMTTPASSANRYFVDLYVNTLGSQPFRTAVQGGRARYEWPCDVREVTFLRLDPVQVSGTEAAIHSLRIEAEGGVVREFSPAELSRWLNVEPGVVAGGAFHLKSERAVNHIESQLSPIAVPMPGGVEGLLRRFPHSWPTRFVGILLGFALALALLGPRGSAWRSEWLVWLLTGGGVFAAIRATRGFPGKPYSAETAAGLSSYGGYGKGRDLLVLIALALAPVLAVLLVRWLRSKRTRAADRAESPCAPLPQAGTRRAWRIALLAGACLIVFLYFLWGASYVSSAVAHAPIPSGWDDGNNQLWAYLYQVGNLPYRDFWYPYGGLILSDAPFPWGFLFERGYIALMLIASFLSFYVITGRSVGRTVILSILWFALLHANVFPGRRYALLAPMVISYAACSGKHERTGLPHFVFWLCTALGMIGDVVMSATGLAAVPLVLLADYWNLRRTPRLLWKQARIRLLRDFAVPAAVAILLSVRLLASGQLKGLLAYLRDLGSIAAYAATPAPIDDWVAFRGFECGFFIWSGAILLGVGLYSYFSGPEEERRRSMAVALLGVTNLVLLQKQLIHNGLPYYLGISVPIAGYLILIFGRHAPFNVPQKFAATVALGVMLGTFLQSGGWSSFAARVRRPSEHWADLKAIFGAPSASEYVKQRWSLTNFRLHPELFAVLEAIRPKLSASNPNDLFALSDEQLLYIAARKKPPYYASLYDGSPLHAQRRTVEWLERNRPAVAVYNVNRQDVFGVPGVIRSPLLFGAAIRGYVLDRRVGDYAILRRRAEGEPLDLSFWGGVLGDINLLALPRLTALDRFGECKGEDCADFLRVRPAVPLPFPDMASIDIAADGHLFHVRFQLLPECPEYAIALDRLWFWGELRRAKLEPALAGHSPQIRVELVRRARRDDILY